MHDQFIVVNGETVEARSFPPVYIHETFPAFNFNTHREALIRQPLIILVDDEPGIRRFICAALKHATGAEVIEAADPGSALEVTRRLEIPIDLLISDVNLSADQTGVDLAREICRSNCSAKVLLISGTGVPPHDMPANWSFLAKPFAISALIECVTRLCAQRST